MTVRNYTSADALLWKQLYYSNPKLSPYQSWEFMDQYLKSVKFGKRRGLLDNQILCCEMNDVSVICPLAIDHQEKAVFLLGDYSSVGYCDLIYGPGMTDEQFEDIINTLKARFSGYDLKLNKVNEVSPFGKYLLRNYDYTNSIKCVSISCRDTGEEYYQNLSKHARQNIRTAYNRMNRNGKDWELHVVNGKGKLSFTQKNAVASIYARRMREKFGKEAYPVPIAFTAQRWINPVFRALNCLDNKFHAFLYIDGQVAAYLSGLFNSNASRIVVPRLSMNGKFEFYDPGIVLIYETVKYLCDNQSGTELDLSRGNEKYKYMMGGKSHLNYSFVI